MPSSLRLATRLPALFNSSPFAARSFTTSVSRRAEQWSQNQPIGPFYEAILGTPKNCPANHALELPSEKDEPAVTPVEKEGSEEAQGKKKPGRKPKTAEST